MGPIKKDLEIVYNLQWKNVPGHGDDKANIVGMYDIPATTLNWETFKSYLLKNSGATGDDVKVSYVSIDDKEFPIESQLDFQIALYSFRQRARNGDIITLKLDRISDQGKTGRMKRLRRSADPHMEEEMIQAASEMKAATPVVVQNDAPPEWFKKYMKGFKKEIVEDVTKSVIDYVSNLKTLNSTQLSCHHLRKTKVDGTKRPRKIPLLLNKPDVNDRELLKSLKLERKLDNKLEKLEQKTIKIKEKKLCLIRNTDDDISSRNSSKSRPIGLPLSDTEILMDASAVGQHESTIPHMSGGETYQQEWEVVNTGDVEWTEITELRYAWGSEALKPVERIVPCPNLKPGEKGSVVVYLEIPKKAGNYECYWHFYHDGRRFGHWLGCQVIVDPPATTKPGPIRLFLNKAEKELLIQSLQATNNLKCRLVSNADVIDKPLNTKPAMEITSSLEGLKIYDTEAIPDSNSSSDSDNQSIVSIADSNSSMHSAPIDEFVVVPMPEVVDVDETVIPEEEEVNDGNLCIPLISTIKIEKVDDVKPDNSMINNENNVANTEEVTVVSEITQQNSEPPVIDVEADPRGLEALKEFEKQIESTYAYITVQGQKIAVPKHLLRNDYLATAEDAPVPIMVTSDASMIASTPKKEDPNDDMISIGCCSITSHSEAAQQNGNAPLDLTLEKEEIQSCKVAEDNYVSSEFNTSSNGCMENLNKSRLFVFPLNCPGFEVVYPPNSCVESLPPDFESIESIQNTKSADGNVAAEYPCGIVYVNTNCPHHEPENPYGYTWSKSDSAYSYTPNAPPPVGFKFETGLPPAPSANGINHSFHDGFANDAGAPHTLHHRFGSYMRRPPFNHAKHCSGMHCRQPLYKNTPATPPKCTGPAENAETFSQYSNDSANNFQQRYRVYMPRTRNPTGITMPQPVPRPPPSNEGQNKSPTGKDRSSTVHILPDTLVSGAVNVASSAINTARSVLNMFSPPPRQEQGEWQNGIWIASDPESPRERALRVLGEMGFWDRNLNATLLARYNDDLARVISELVQ